MTKEVVRKYKDVFDYWLDGGKVWIKDSSNTWKYTSHPDWDEPSFLLVKADKYAEFRKAHADGKVIECRDGGHWIVCKVPHWNIAIDRYRIKPKFKVGDWIINTTHSKPKPMVVTQDMLDDTSPHNHGNHLEPWQPQEGDVVVYWDDDCTDKYIGKYSKELSNYSDNIIPYIGQDFKEMI